MSYWHTPPRSLESNKGGVLSHSSRRVDITALQAGTDFPACSTSFSKTSKPQIICHQHYRYHSGYQDLLDDVEEK